MATTLGIVAEYNPLHNGHLYQLAQAKRQAGADRVVVVMSGNFVQRGEPALLDKWQRASLALSLGVDLVVELPFLYTNQPAHLFARGAIQILSLMGCDVVAFGAEHPELDFAALSAYQSAHDQSHFKQFDENYPNLFHDYLLKQTGVSLKASNDILGFAYAAANQQLAQPMQLLPIQRQGSDHQAVALEVSDSVASGAAIREALAEGDRSQVEKVVPKATFEALEEGPTVSWADYWPYLRYRLLSTSLDQLQRVYQMTEGIEYRLQRVAQESTEFETFLRAAKTKRYTYARLQRLAVATLLQVPENAYPKQLDFVRVLGFNAVGQQLLNQVKKTTPVPIITKVTTDWIDGPYWMDDRAGQLREMVTGINQDRLRHPIVKP